jgi:hypothetical protein
MAKPMPRVVRRVLPWLLGWWAVQGGLAVAGRVLARRRNEGDESSTAIQRVMAVGGVELRPINPKLSRVRFDLLMGGGVLDLTALPRVPGGIDVTVRAVMGGVSVRVPAGWRVWWTFSGVAGGVASKGPVVRARDETTADLRLHVHAVFGGTDVSATSGR